MKAEVVKELKLACQKLRLNCNYLVDTDIYFIHKNGRAITGFTAWQFYGSPKRLRMDELLPLLKVGLANNLGEKYKDQVFSYLKYGKKIC